MKARLQIRRHTYRGRPGFLICGTDWRGCSGISVFVRTRPAAEAYRDLLADPTVSAAEHHAAAGRIFAADNAAAGKDGLS